jgi:hypothetical protein
MQTKTKNMLPKTANEIANGGVYSQRVRCGKSNCKCARGEKHIGYYFFERINGKLFKTYVRKVDVEAFTELVNIAAAERQERRALNKHLNEALKRIRESLRESEQVTKSYKESYNNDQS